MAEPKALPLSLLAEITNGFSGKQQIGFAVVYQVRHNSTPSDLKKEYLNLLVG